MLSSGTQRVESVGEALCLLTQPAEEDRETRLGWVKLVLFRNAV